MEGIKWSWKDKEWTDIILETGFQKFKWGIRRNITIGVRIRSDGYYQCTLNIAGIPRRKHKRGLEKNGRPKKENRRARN